MAREHRPLCSYGSRVNERVPAWVRLGMILTLAVPQLLIGLWAYVAPESWFDSFPGFDPRLVAAIPPYNQHLASDVGAGFLATGAALLVGAVWANRTGVRVALVAFAAFTVPHVVYHRVIRPMLCPLWTTS